MVIGPGKAKLLAALGTVAIKELARATALLGISYASGVLASRSHHIMMSDIGKLNSARNSLLGARGPRFDNKSFNLKSGARIDVENQKPGVRTANIHYQEPPGNIKWVFGVDWKKFVYDKDGRDQIAPPKIQKLLEDTEVKNAINKALYYLNEKSIY